MYISVGGLGMMLALMLIVVCEDIYRICGGRYDVVIDNQEHTIIIPPGDYPRQSRKVPRPEVKGPYIEEQTHSEGETAPLKVYAVGTVLNNKQRTKLCEYRFA